MGLELNFSAKNAIDEFKKLKKGLKDVGTDVSGTIKQLESLKKTTKTLGSSLKGSGNKEAAESFSKLSKEIEDTISHTKKLKGSFSGLNKETNQTSRAINVSSASYQKARKEIDKYETQVLNAMYSIDKYKNQVEKTQKEIKTYKSQISSLTKEQSRNEKEILKAWTANYKYEKSVDSLVSKNKQLGISNKQLNGSWQASRHQVARLKKEIDGLNKESFKSGKVNIDLQKRVSKLTNELNKLDKEHRVAIKTAKSYDMELVKTWKEIDRYKSKIISLTNRIDRMNKKNKEAAYSINKVMKAASTIRNLLFLSTMVYGVQRFSNAIIKLGSDFDKTMTIVGAVTQNVGKDFTTGGYENLISKALELGATTEYTSNQAAEAMKNLGLAGFSTRQILATVPGVLDLATAGQVDLATASQLTVQALTAMGLKTSDTEQLLKNVTRVTDTFIATATRTNTTVESIAEAFTYVAQSARNTGMEIEDLTNYIGLLGSSGIQGSMAGTQLAFAISKQYKAMEALGLNPALSNFRDVLEQINEQGWNFNDIYKVFIQRGSRAVLALKDMLPVLDNLNKLQKESGLSAKELADIYRNTVSINLQKIKSLFENIGIDAFRREQGRLNDSLKNFYDTLSNNKEELINFASLFVKMTAGAFDFFSLVAEKLPAMVDFYKVHKKMIEILLVGIGSLLLANKQFKEGLLLIALGGASFGIDLSGDADQVKILTIKIKGLEEQLKSIQDVESKYSSDKTKSPSYSGYEYTKRIINKQIEELKSERETLYGNIEKEKQTPENQNKIINETLRNQKQIIDGAALRFQQDIKFAQDIEGKAAKEYRDSEEKLNELLGGDANKVKFRGKKLKFIGDAPLESQMADANEKLKDSIKEKNEVLNRYKSDLKNHTIELSSLENEMASTFEGERPVGAGSDFEKFISLQTNIDKERAIVKKLDDSISNYKNVIKNYNEAIDVTNQLFSQKIAKRDYEKEIEFQGKIIEVEKKGYNIRKSLFDDAIKYRTSAHEKYIGDAVNRQIEEQRRLFAEQKKRNEFAGPDEKISQERMARLEVAWKKHWDLLEKYRDVKVEIGASERLNEEISRQKEMLQRKYDLISGFSAKEIKEKRKSLNEQMALELKAFDASKEAQEELMRIRESDPNIPSQFKITKEDLDDWLSASASEREVIVKEWLKRLAEETTITIDSIGDEFESMVQSSLGNILSDTMKGEFKDIGQYFSSLVDDMIGMWSQMVAQMIIKQQTIGMLGGVGSFAAMGAAGVALYAASSIIGKSEERAAEKKRKKALRKQLESELGDSLAQLKLSDTSYEIYQLNDRIGELTKQARDANYPMKEIVELRKLETKAILDDVASRYRSVIDSANDWITGIQREDWTLDDWRGEYDRLHNDLINLDKSSNEYQDNSISALEGMLDAVKNAYEIQKEQLNALKSLDQSLGSQIWDLRNTGNVPTAIDEYRGRYNELLNAASMRDGNDFIDEQAVQEFQNFVSSYLDTLSGSGFDYNELLYGQDGVIGSLESIQGDVKTEMERLADAIDLNKDELEKNTISLGDVKFAIEELADLTRKISQREVYSTWQDLNPANLPNETFASSIGQSPADLPSDENIWVKATPGGYSALQNYRSIDFINNAVQATLDWTKQIDPSISPEIADWLKRGDGLFTLDPLTNVSQMDYNGDGRIDIKDKPLYDEWVKQGNDVLEWAKEINDIPVADLSLLNFAKGGWANEASIFGETGYGEYAVPDANNPNNSHFLKSVGVNSTEIGNAIGDIIMSRLSDVDSNKEIVVNLNGKEIARQTVEEIRRTPSYRDSIRKR